MAEGEKQSAILKADAAKQAAILQAEGAKQAKILEAEAEAEAILKVQQATADASGSSTRPPPARGTEDQGPGAFTAAANGKATKIIIPARSRAGRSGGRGQDHPGHRGPESVNPLIPSRGACSPGFLCPKQEN